VPIIVTGANVTHNSREKTIHQNIHNEAVDTHDRVSWDEALNLEPIMTTILYIKPLWESAGEKIRNAWQALFAEKNDVWRDKVEHWTVLSDNSVVLTIKDHASIIDMACSTIAYLHERFKKENASSFFPAYIAIDSGAYLRADKIALQDLHIPWEEMVPGDIYVSKGSYTILKEYCPSLPSLVKKGDKNASFFKLTINYGEDKQSPLFLYHDAFIQGAHAACFYCGSKKHPVDRCPSKTLPEVTDAIRKAGYKSLEEINKIFLEYVNTSDASYEALGDEPNNIVLVHQAFYDLKRIFQLRLFRTLWDTEVKVWDNVKNRIYKGNRSGITWIAQDCIRISDIRRAESLLEDSLKEDPHDYKVYCTWGFLNVEKSNLSKAEQFFEKALSCTKTNPEKIFLNFLLFRIYEITGHFEKAYEKIKEILAIEPYCAEALYIDIVSQFRRGGKNEPLQRLLKLIQDEREYYLYALIDPDLKSFNDIINPHLREIFSNVKDHAKGVLRETEEELKRLKKIFGQDDDVVKRVDESWLIINKLADTDSYFGYLDVVYHGLSIMKTVHRTIGEYKKELSESILKCAHQIRSYVNFLENYPNKKIALPLVEKLEMLEIMARENWRKIGLSNIDEIKVVLKNKQLLFQELELIAQHMKRLMTIQWMREFYSKFMKRNIIFISIILAAAFVVMPIIVFYVNLVLLELRILPVYDIWIYQKMVMVIGSLCGVILSFFITFFDVPKKDFVVN
jgi:tetratricopeptide (TPR) repeat protein